MAAPTIGHASYRVRHAATIVQPTTGRAAGRSDFAHSIRRTTTSEVNANSSGSVIGVLCR